MVTVYFDAINEITVLVVVFFISSSTLVFDKQLSLVIIGFDLAWKIVKFSNYADIAKNYRRATVYKL